MIDLHTELPISELKLGLSPEQRELYRKFYEDPPPSNDKDQDP